MTSSQIKDNDIECRKGRGSAKDADDFITG